MRIFVLTSALLLSSISMFGQGNKISDGEFQAALRKAYDIADTLPHRRITFEEFFRDGKKSGYEKHTTETLPPNKTRYIYESAFRGERESREIIKINGVSYCKEGKEKWRKANCDRFTGIPGSSVISDEFTLEEINKDNKIVRQFARNMTYSFPDGKDEKVIRTMYLKSSFEVDEYGKLISQESIRGYVGSDEFRSISKTSFEYDIVDLKIEAPVK